MICVWLITIILDCLCPDHWSEYKLYVMIVQILFYNYNTGGFSKSNLIWKRPPQNQITHINFSKCIRNLPNNTFPLARIHITSSSPTFQNTCTSEPYKKILLKSQRATFLRKDSLSKWKRSAKKWKISLTFCLRRRRLTLKWMGMISDSKSCELKNKDGTILISRLCLIALKFLSIMQSQTHNLTDNQIGCSQRLINKNFRSRLEI